MKQYVSLQKQSRKKQHIEYAKQRGSWNGINPITKVIPSKKLYNRNHEKRMLESQ